MALEFLGIIPLPFRNSSLTSDQDIGRSSLFFPFIGFIYGLILLISSLIIVPLVSKDVCGILLSLILVILSRGLHIDGLSDTFDALGFVGSKERRLDIMKDSTVGPFGVTAVFFVLLLKIFLISSLTVQGGLFYISILMFPVVGRWSIVVALYFGNSARDNGLGRIFFLHTKGFEFFWTTVITINILGFAVLFDLGAAAFVGIYHELLYFLVLPAAYLTSVFLVRIFIRSFGGLTGDNLGAICELSEVITLLTFVIVGGIDK